MLRNYTSVSRYIQGPGALDKLAEISADWGEKPVIVTDEIMKNLLGDKLASIFSKAPEIQILTFPGEVTHATIEDLSRRAQGADLVIGIGGGKALDTAKGVALSLKANMISVPTIAATDAPASFAIAVYNDHHLLTDILKLPRNPDVVLADTNVICSAPVRFLIAGIGDAISKKFEAEACSRAGAEMLMGGPSTAIGLAVADACYRVIRNHARGAVDAVTATGKPNADVEALIEATVLMSTLAFENGGLSVSHAIAKGLPMAPSAAGTMHGEHVAYGLLVQLILEERETDFVLELINFYRSINLPVSLADLGIGPGAQQEVDTIVENAMLSPSLKRFYRELGPVDLKNAISRVEALHLQ